MVRRAAQMLVVLALALVGGHARAAELRVTFFDVGQGDCALIVSPAGRTVLIDAGPPESADALRARLGQILDAPIDLVVLTHAHLDHFGGMAEAIGVRGARLFVQPGFDHPSPSYEALLRRIDEQQIRRVNAAAGHSFDLGGGARLDLLAPGTPLITGTVSDAGANSVVVELVYGKRRFLFAGDIVAETEAALLARKLDLRADVLKVAHHGARGSSIPAFLDAVQPSVAVVSVGGGNAIGAPSRSVVDRLLAGRARVLRTDLDGEIRISTDGDALHVDTGAPSPTRVARVETPKPPRHERDHDRGRAHDRDHDRDTPKGFTTIAVPVERVVEQSGRSKPRAEPKSTPSRGGYVASESSEVFHKADCRNAKRIKAENRVTFSSRQDALDSGRRPAGCCNP